MQEENSPVWLNKSDLLQGGPKISSFLLCFFKLNNEAMTHAQGTTQVSERCVDIKAGVIPVSLDCILKYTAVNTLLNRINKADLITAELKACCKPKQVRHCFFIKPSL